VGEDVAIERIERGVIDIRREDTLAQVIQLMCPRRICGRVLHACSSEGLFQGCLDT
jgi:hypothetical protein